MGLVCNLGRHRRGGNLLTLAMALLATNAAAQFTPYAARTEFLLTPPGVHPGALAGFINPATLALLPAPEVSATFATAGNKRSVRSDWGWYASLPHLGGGVLHRQRPGLSDLTEARIGLGLGDQDVAFGVGRGWSTGRGPQTSSVWISGVLFKPSPKWSFASTWTKASGGQGREIAGDVGYRPMGDDQLTLFAEGVRSDRAAGRERFWSLGANYRALDGVHVSGRFLDGHSISLGLRLEFGELGVRSQARQTSRNSGTRRLAAVRFGPHRGDAATRYREPVYVDLPMSGSVRHRAYRLLDDGTSQLDLIADLRAIERDPRVEGVAINLSGLRIDPALSWELREHLLALRTAGRHVTIYVDRARLRKYHLASAADRIVLDPYGVVGLEGLVAGRMYLAQALEKLGIGTQQWRTGEFKTAFEDVSRTDMSDGDRRQLMALLEDAYTGLRRDITESRGLSEDTFDFLVDGAGVFTAEEALAEGLVDTLARWQDVDPMMRAMGAHRGISTAQLARPSETIWGRPPTIALVYALGVCDLDTGIRARQLTQQLRDLATDGRVDAVVLRVDSPGGDVLASDWVAEAVAEVRDSKPIIISHGRLAASGGYWISMEGDVIVTSPHTITGSIGVVGGWLYEDGLKEKLGIQTDRVQVGAHADLGFGARIPLLGLSLPDRPLDTKEAARVDEAIFSMYERFIARVADARGHSIAHVDSVAQGRVWSGHAAVEHGLADTIGTLSTAIDIARQRAAIDADRLLRVIEIPARGWLAPRSGVLPFGLFARRLAAEQVTPILSPLQSWLEFRSRHNGQAMPMLPDTFIGSETNLTGEPHHE